MDKNTINISPVNIKDRQKLELRAGDTVRVQVKIQEKGKTRLQAFEGLVLAVKHGSEPGSTFTVRKVSGGIGVERIFPLYSPNIDKIEIVKRAKVRRAKLYHIRDKVAREIKRQMRRMQMVNISSLSSAEEELRAKEEEEKLAKDREEMESKAKEEVVSSDIPDIEGDEDKKEDSSLEENENKKVENNKDENSQSVVDDKDKKDEDKVVGEEKK